MRDRDLIVLALAVVLAGCPLGTSTTTTLTGGRTTTVAPTADSAATDSAATAAVASSPDGPGITGAIVRRQLEALHGLTPDEAKQQLKKLGHDGKISLGEVSDSGGGHTYIKSCGQNKVCYTSGESGIGIHDDLTLYINPTLKIAAPPP